MKIFDRSRKFGLLVTIITACTLEYVGPATARPVQNPNNPYSDTSLVAGFTSTQGIIIQPALTATAPPKRDFSVQASNLSFLPLISLYYGDSVWGMLRLIDIDRALNDLRQLTGISPTCNDKGCYTITNRLPGSEGLNWAKEHVYKQLDDLGYSVELQNWSRSGYADQNVIARKPGVLHPEEEVFFVAHIDGKNSPAADDNGSGVVDILELARVLNGYTFNRTVVMFFSTGEEQGSLGVDSYLDQLTPGELSAIRYVVNIDMVGYDANSDSVMELWHGDHPPSRALTQMIRDTIQDHLIDLKPDLVTGCG